MPAAEVVLKLQSQVAPQIAATVSAYQQLSTAEQKAAQSAATYAKTQTQVALTDAKVATEEQRKAVVTANAAKAQDQAALSALRLSQAQNKVATGNSFAAQTASALKSQVLGIVGPVAIVTTAFGVLKGALDLTESSFKLKAALDSTNASIALSLSGVRDSGQTFQEAAAFADKYKLTQQETAQAIQASIPILRSSNASLTDVESTLLRLQAKKPEKSIADAARALDELKSGQIISIVDQFNISRDAANKLKDEIAHGGDAVKILSDYLTGAGFGMQALDIRTQGATGKINELTVETEKFQLALGGQSGGPGLALLNARIDLTRGGTRLLSGDFTTFGKSITDSVAAGNSGLLSFFNVLQPFAQLVQRLPGYQQLNTQATAQGTGAYNAAVAAVRGNAGASGIFSGVLSEETQKKLDSTQATAQLNDQQRQLNADSALAAQGMLGAGDQALVLAQKYGIAAGQAQFLINQQQALSNATALADQRKGEQTGTTNTAAEFDKFNTLARKGDADRAADKKRADDKAAADSARLQDAQNNLNLSRAKTSAQKIAELQRQQRATSDPVEQLQLQAQIEQERNSTAKAHTSELDKQLKLNESNYDSVDKQRQAVIDLGVQQARNRLDNLKDQDELKKANAILNSSASSVDLKARAQAKKDVVLADEAKRDFEIGQQQATAGGTIINGKLYQSVPGAGGPLPSPPSGGTAPRAAAGAAGAPAPDSTSGGGRELIIQMDGQQVAKLILPYAWAELDGAIQHARITQGA